MQLVRVSTFCGLLFTTVHSYLRQEMSIEEGRKGGGGGGKETGREVGEGKERRGRGGGDERVGRSGGGEGEGMRGRRREWRRRGGGDEREEKGVEKERGTRRRKG